MGAPGVGKGTQARAVSLKYAIPTIATGEMLRSAMECETPLGREAKKFVERGDLVPDHVIIGVVEERLTCQDAVRGFLLDGFPRTLAQAEALDMLLRDKGLALDAAIAIEVPDEVIVDRLGGRLTCGACGMVYGADSGLNEADLCGNCGEPLAIRADDTPDAIRHRLKVFRKNTEPLVDYYRGKGILKIIDGDRSRDAVAASIEAALSG